MTRDEKIVLYDRTIERLHINGVRGSVDIVVALQNEIDCYRKKIEAMQTALDEKCNELKGERAISGDLRRKMLEREFQYAELNKTLDGLKAEINRESEPTTLEAVQENTAGEIIKALADSGYNISINLFKDNESEV